MRLLNTICALSLFIVTSNILQAQTYREFIALYELNQKTNGENWTKKWNLDAPIQTWEGVTIKNGHVVALDLSDNNLTGELPVTLVNLRHLESLNLSGNKLVGKLPASMGRFEQLSYFNVSKNAFTGKVPRGISRMYRLKSLQLADNNFEDYSRLEKIRRYQLVAFDMASDFAHLGIMDSEGLAETKFEDIID